MPFLLTNDGQRRRGSDLGAERIVDVAPLGAGSDCRVHRETEPGLCPIGRLVDISPADVLADHQDINVVGRSADLAGMTGRRSRLFDAALSESRGLKT